MLSRSCAPPSRRGPWLRKHQLRKLPKLCRFSCARWKKYEEVFHSLSLSHSHSCLISKRSRLTRPDPPTWIPGPGQARQHLRAMSESGEESWFQRAGKSDELEGDSVGCVGTFLCVCVMEREGTPFQLPFLFFCLEVQLELGKDKLRSCPGRIIVALWIFTQPGVARST